MSAETSSRRAIANHLGECGAKLMRAKLHQRSTRASPTSRPMAMASLFAHGAHGPVIAARKPEKWTAILCSCRSCRKAGLGRKTLFIVSSSAFLAHHTRRPPTTGKQKHALRQRGRGARLGSARRASQASARSARTSSRSVAEGVSTRGNALIATTSTQQHSRAQLGSRRLACQALGAALSCGWRDARCVAC